MGQPPDSGRGSAGPQETCPQAALRMMFMPESDPGPTRALFRAGGRVRGMFAPNHTSASARYVRCCILGGQWWAMRIVPSTDQGPSADARPGQTAWPPFPGWARPGWRRPRRRLTWEGIMPIQKQRGGHQQARHEQTQAMNAAPTSLPLPLCPDDGHHGGAGGYRAI